MDRLRVLIIDDSLTIRAMVEALVEQQPHCRVVGVASDLETARRMMEELVPNVVTLDLGMPGGGGLQFLDELRDQPHAPIVVVSAATRDGCAASEEALAHGADACFDKARLISEADRFVRVLRKAARRKSRRLVACAA